MQQAIALLTGGAEGAGDARDPSRTIASERALNRGRAGGAIPSTPAQIAIQQSDLMPAHFEVCDNSRGGAVEFAWSHLSLRAAGRWWLIGDIDSLDGAKRPLRNVGERPWV